MRIRHAFASPFGRSTRPAPGLGHRRSRYGGWPWGRTASPACHGRRYGKRRRKDLLSDVAQQHRRLVCRGKASTAKERERRPPIPHSSLARFHQAPAGIGKAWNGYLERPSIRRVEQGADHLRSTLERLPSSAPTVPENVYTAHLSIRLRKWPADAADADRKRPAPGSGGQPGGPDPRGGGPERARGCLRSNTGTPNPERGDAGKQTVRKRTER
jgi:hypothetical protein